MVLSSFGRETQAEQGAREGQGVEGVGRGRPSASGCMNHATGCRKKFTLGESNPWRQELEKKISHSRYTTSATATLVKGTK
jgi:hypothetical protein